MKLAVFNGSPRGTASNSRLLVEMMLAGLNETPGHSVDIAYLRNEKEHPRFLEMFGACDVALVILPLYADSMPGIAKSFIESLRARVGRTDNPKLGFVVQSGFPESAQSEPVARYLEKLARRLGCECLGVAIKGGVEGMQVMPPWMTRGIRKGFTALGRSLGTTGRFDPAVLARLRGKPRLTPVRLLAFRAATRLGLADSYWNAELREHHAFERRFDRPLTAG